MPGALNILVSHPSRLIAVALPECASSTLAEVFLRLAGFDPQPGRVRSLATRARADGRLAAAGMEFHQCWPDDIAAVVAANPGYRVFSVVRDPYGRIRSAYFNKLNRYTRPHRPLIYAGSRLAMLFGGPKAWRSVEYGNRFAHRFIGFGDFLAELDRLGVGIDPHFDLQTRLLARDTTA